jgi:cation:H+ antiporter
MLTPVALLLFVTSLAATLAAAGVFARRLDRLGVRLGIPEAVLGLLTALAADGPELSSGVTAMARGERGIGVGVLLGSNVFNIAAMVGASALLAGRVRLDRGALLVEGAFALFATAVAAGVLFGWLPAWAAVALLAAATAPYLVVLARGTFHGPSPPRAPGPDDAVRVPQVVRLFVRELPALAVIVIGSVGMVYTAVLLAGRYGVPRPLVGLLILATMTSLPNASTAIRLGLAGRGEALVSETLNSNTINLAFGIVVPALFVTAARAPAGFELDFVWMLAVTLAMLVLVGRRAGAGRLAGAAIVASYVAYVVVRIAITTG